MRLSDLSGKEVINVYDGARLGVIGDADLVVDINTGEIHSIIMPQRNGAFSFWMDRQHLIIPWAAVKKIGNEVIIVDLDPSVPNFRRYPG